MTDARQSGGLRYKTGFVAMMAPAVLAPWFPRHRGIALGIWATWVPVGLLTMLLVAPALADGV